MEMWFLAFAQPLTSPCSIDCVACTHKCDAYLGHSVSSTCILNISFTSLSQDSVLYAHNGS